MTDGWFVQRHAQCQAAGVVGEPLSGEPVEDQPRSSRRGWGFQPQPRGRMPQPLWRAQYDICPSNSPKPLYLSR